MWVVAKYKKKKFIEFKNKSKNSFEDIVLYRPKILINYFKNNKLIEKEICLFNDYIFIYSKDFIKKNKLNNLNFTNGIKSVLNNSIFNQKELNDFISKCKNFEDSHGYLKQDFFNFLKKKHFKFSTGPFTNLVFSLVEETRNRIKILIGKNSYTVKKDKYLYFPI